MIYIGSEEPKFFIRVYSLIVGDEIVGCSGIFADTQLIYSPVFFMFMIFKFCLPIWSLLAVLEPLPTGISYSEILATSHSGVCVYICEV